MKKKKNSFIIERSNKIGPQIKFFIIKNIIKKKILKLNFIKKIKIILKN
jgi:hypothetical protein